MKKAERVNLAASVHARLLNRARTAQRTFNDLAQLYAMERFLYRTSQSPYARRFVLKGALLMRVWNPDACRTTRDIDLLGRIPNDRESVTKAIEEICRCPAEPDGLAFDPSSVRVESITEHAQYEGVRVNFVGALGGMRLVMRVDIGFGDRVYPSPQPVDFPTFLPFPAPRLLMYPPEAVVAEKLHTMLVRGQANTRMKDFYDVAWLAAHREFDGSTLARSIISTCTGRGLKPDSEAVIFTPQFRQDGNRSAHWRAFWARHEPRELSADFSDVAERIAEFLHPVVWSLSRGEGFNGSWSPSGPWQ